MVTQGTQITHIGLVDLNATLWERTFHHNCYIIDDKQHQMKEVALGMDFGQRADLVVDLSGLATLLQISYKFSYSPVNQVSSQTRDQTSLEERTSYQHSHQDAARLRQVKMFVLAWRIKPLNSGRM